MTERTQRRLAAIVSADVVGYSRLMGADEAGTHARLQSRFSSLIEPMIARHHGRVVKLMGDGLLAEFSSVVDAVSWAVESQTKVAEISADETDERRIEYRVGVNLGDVIIDGDDIFGDGVNVAARLQEIAVSGGIAISGNVQEQIRDKLDLRFTDDGMHEVKNIARPIHVWRWSPHGEATATAPIVEQDVPLALPDKPSIAVLPFDNMSGDPEQEFFADGIAEDVITALSRFSSLFVIARNSSFTYKGKAVDISRVGRELGVRYVVEGSVRKAGNRVRITAQLIDAASGNHLWADRFDGTLDDVFDLQDQITEQIVIAVEPEIGTRERERARRKSPGNLDAWELFQRGLWHFYRITKEDIREARSLFNRAIERDPNFSSPHAGVSYTHLFDRFQEFSDDLDESLNLGLAAGARAVALDEKDGFAHYVFGRLLAINGESDRGISELEKSISLNPSFAQGHFGLGAALSWNGRPAEGIVALEIAKRLSPQDPMMWAFDSHLSACCSSLKRFDEAVNWARMSVNVRPELHQVQMEFIVALIGQNRIEDARHAVEAVRRLLPDLTLSVIRQFLSHTSLEHREQRIDALRKAGLPE